MSAGQYLTTARTFLTAAIALEALANEEESYGSAIGLLATHACISFADAVTIAFGGRKSTGTHDQIAMLLVDILGPRFPHAQRQQLLRVISEKDTIAYQGRQYALADATRHLTAARKFSDWVEGVYAEKP